MSSSSSSCGGGGAATTGGAEGRDRLEGGAADESRSTERDALADDGGGEDFVFELDELFWVRPLTFNSSATARNELSSSWATFTSPWYIKLSTDWRSAYLTPFRYKSGCWWGFRCRRTGSLCAPAAARPPRRRASRPGRFRKRSYSIIVTRMSVRSF